MDLVSDEHKYTYVDVQISRQELPKTLWINISLILLKKKKFETLRIT